MQLEPAKRRFTVEEYYLMDVAGILLPDEQVELLDGGIYLLPRRDSHHASCSMRMNHYFSNLFDRNVMLHPHNPVRLNAFSEPVPDLALLRWQEDYYRKGHPTPKDIFVVIEIAGAADSLYVDRGYKLSLYARAEIAEVWIVNLTEEQIELHRDPADGLYRFGETFGPGQLISSQSLPDYVIEVDNILGKY